MPVSMIPWVGSVAEKGVTVAAEKIMKDRVTAKQGWFMLLSDVYDPKSARASLGGRAQ